MGQCDAGQITTIHVFIFVPLLCVCGASLLPALNPFFGTAMANSTPADTTQLEVEALRAPSPQACAKLLVGRRAAEKACGAATTAPVSRRRPIAGLGRRKLTDAIMQGFVVGNTAAQSLLGPQDAAALAAATPVRLLYLGVGDVRNPLSALCQLPHSAAVVVHVNDTSAVVLARNVLMLAVASVGTPEAVAAAIAMWCDAELTSEHHSIVVTTLQRLLTSPSPSPSPTAPAAAAAAATAAATTSPGAAVLPWLVVEGGSQGTLVQCWRAWLSLATSVPLADARKRRQAALRTSSSVGHGRVGASDAWIQVGVSSRPPIAVATPAVKHGKKGRKGGKKKKKKNGKGRGTGNAGPPGAGGGGAGSGVVPEYGTTHLNPTLFHPFTLAWLDMQGPAGAFHGLDRFEAGSAAFAAALHAAWTPLLRGWAQRVATVRWHVWVDECTSMLRRLDAGTLFHAIDTSNVMDYVGLYVHRRAWLGVGCWVLGVGCWVLGVGCWVLGVGCCG